MAKKVSEAVYDFPYGETHSHIAVVAADISQLEDNKPGLYAWYVRVLPKETATTDLSCYGGFFGSKKYTVDLSASLGEQYQGKLKLNPAFDVSRAANVALLSTVTTVFSPPIYIGIAKNIRKRLLTHLDKLEKALVTPPAAVLSPTPVDDDSDEESGYFGGRVGELLRELKVSDVRNLFVKIVYQPVDDLVQRRGVEHFVNRVFFPFCGRK
jgi:hypothetical protein